MQGVKGPQPLYGSFWAHRLFEALFAAQTHRKRFQTLQHLRLRISTESTPVLEVPLPANMPLEVGLRAATKPRHKDHMTSTEKELGTNLAVVHMNVSGFLRLEHTTSRPTLSRRQEVRYETSSATHQLRPKVLTSLDLH